MHAYIWFVYKITKYALQSLVWFVSIDVLCTLNNGGIGMNADFQLVCIQVFLVTRFIKLLLYHHFWLCMTQPTLTNKTKYCKHAKYIKLSLYEDVQVICMPLYPPLTPVLFYFCHKILKAVIIPPLLSVHNTTYTYKSNHTW
jgi:hypothetical protein